MSFEVRVEKRLGGHAVAADFTAEGPVTALVGPSGIGKTSILNMVAGILGPDAGRIVVAGRALFDADAGIDLPPEQRHAGYVFQDDRLFPHLNVENNLLYGQKLARARDARIEAGEVIALLGLEPLLRRLPRNLSGGEARRVAIGRAMLARPAFLLLDEPLTSLDEALREEMLRTVERVRDQFRLPILYVSHNPEEVRRITAEVVRLSRR
ncbi:MAG TPA: ATP-binding cassette domain-containing protein [Allosphingosinicella sp.]|nr:ATP-binding cassette domain-containing protein [Allosphingosinicella sp.]